MIDPHLQAISWVKERESQNNLQLEASGWQATMQAEAQVWMMTQQTQMQDELQQQFAAQTNIVSTPPW